MITKKTKRQIMERAEGFCEYCKSPSIYSTEPFCIDHIIPKSKGGTDEIENLCFSCYGCNSHKYNKTESFDTATNNKIPLYNPRKDIWKENFAWSESTLQIIGITPIGRATINALKINRPNIQNLRKLLYNANEHPPLK